MQSSTELLGIGAPALTLMIVIILLLLLAKIPASIAKKKGYSYGGFFLFGLLFFLPALVVALLVQDRNLVSEIASVVQKGTSADEIGKYKQLLDSGAISAEEYEQKKKKLLDQ